MQRGAGYLEVFGQVAVVNLDERLFGQNTAGRPLAAGVVRLGASLQQPNGKEGDETFRSLPLQRHRSAA